MTRQSAQRASSIPPATAGPSITAMTGVESSRREGARNRPALLWEVQLGARRLVVACRHALQVRACAKRSALAPEHCHSGRIVPVEGQKRLIQRLGMFRVYRIAR